MPKQTKDRQPSSCEPEGMKSLSEARVERSEVSTGSPARKRTALTKTTLTTGEKLAGSGAEPVRQVGAHSSPAQDKSTKKAMKLLSTNTREIPKIYATESLPEVGAKPASNRKGRMVPSRYKESAKSRAAATPTKMSDSSCISINQSKLFSTATSSTPVSGSGNALDVSVRPRQPPKMAALDSTVRQRPPASATTGKDKTALKIKKSDKAATIKVKPMRAEAPAKPQKGGDRERASDHQLLYNQYLQWTYLCRLSEASIRTEQPQLSHQARQLSGLVDSARRDCLHLERKLHAVALYREMVQLERQLGHVLTDVNDSGDTVRADLSRLATSLDATRSRLQLKACVEPADSAAFVEELVPAVERCRQALAALDEAAAPHANLLQHTADTVGSLQQALRHSCQHMESSVDMLQGLSSLALQEASLSLTGCTLSG